ncbi:MAG: hypothetical protein QOJ94_715 [Sphingomonadales bacterium]|nr:hypothetical protein [Sphingomonadales bacterium]
MKRMLLAAAFLFSIGAAAPAIGAFDQPAPAAERTYWEVRWDDALCTLTRRHTGEHPVSFSLALAPTSRLVAVQLDFDGPELETRGGKSKLDLLFSPGGGSLPLDFTVLHEGGRNNLIAFSNTAWLDRLAAARSISFGGSGRFPVVELGDAAKAVAGLRACRDDMLREWGVDGAALDALRRLPDLDGPPALGLPMAHLARGQGGAQPRPLSRLEVTADGRVAACRVVLGSRGADTDSKICELWQRRARFRPALAADGRPVPATIIAEFIWKIP